MKHRMTVIMAVILTLSCGFTHAVAPLQEITVTQMRFYDAGGVLNILGNNDTVAGSVNSDGTGSFNSGGTDFVGSPWVADQQMWDSTPGTGKNWSGTSAQGAYSYTYDLAENQVAIGVYFDWSVNLDIPVLQIFDCPNGTAGDCVGVHSFSPGDLAAHDDHPAVPGSPMVTTPFPGQHATFVGTTAANIDATPVANDDTTGATADTVNTLDVLVNDTDFEDAASSLTVNLIAGTSAQGFLLSVNPDGSISYTTTGGYLGSDTFAYTVTDSFGNTSVAATVNITVSSAPNAAPVALDPAVSTDEDTAVIITMAMLAEDVDGDAMFMANFDATTTSGGSVTVNAANNELTYTPATNFDGPTDTFTYQVDDTVDSSLPGMVTVTVNAVNDNPVCTDVDLFTDSDTVLTIIEITDLISNCSDVEGDTLSVATTTDPMQGTLASDGAGTLTYTPDSGFTGADSFNFTVSDGQGGTSVPATVNITVGILYGNFTMLDVSGETFGGTNDVTFVWDGIALNVDENDTNFGVMTIESNGPEPFFGAPWVAHHVRVFGEGTYTFDTTCTVAQIEAGLSVCDNLPLPDGQTEQFMTLTVGAGQFGAHILFDWNGNVNIDVVNLWDVDGVWEDADGDTSAVNDLYTGPAGTAPDPATTWDLVSRDVNGDGINGSPMIDGPFIGYYANFSDGPQGTGTALPDITTTAADTQLGGGVLNWGVLLLMLPMIALLRRRI